MKKEIEIQEEKDNLDELVVEDKKKRGWLFLLIVLIFLSIIFYAYSVYAPIKKTLAFENLPSIVYQSETVITGVNAKPGSRLRLVVNLGEPIFLVVDENGKFTAKIELVEGDNFLEVSTIEDNKTDEQKISASINYVLGETNPEALESQSESEVEEVFNNSNPNSSSSSSQPSNSNNSSDIPNNNSDDQDSDMEEQIEDEGPLIIYPSKVIISYILYSGGTSVLGYDEYIELKNTGGEDKNITGWVVSDGDGNSFTFSDYILSVGASVRITTNTGRFVFNSNSPVWARVGEPGYLKDSSRRLVDVYSY